MVLTLFRLTACLYLYLDLYYIHCSIPPMLVFPKRRPREGVEREHFTRDVPRLHNRYQPCQNPAEVGDVELLYEGSDSITVTLRVPCCTSTNTSAQGSGGEILPLCN